LPASQAAGKAIQNGATYNVNMSARLTVNSDRAVQLGRETLSIEAQAITNLVDRLGDAFASACAMILQCQGRLVVTGMGKSGHIANKLAATFASTGTPAFFVHPAEASHGDLGMITPDDLVLAISYSGESDEINAILPALKRRGARVIGISGKSESTLAKQSDVWLDVAVHKEACPNNLAPTASTTATLALGDALAVAVLDARGFSREDFAMHHPGGSLGRRLLVTVRDVMHAGDELPKVSEDAAITDAIAEMSRRGLGLTAVVASGSASTLAGIFTDGDLRRAIEKHGDLRRLLVRDLMGRNPRTITAEKLAAQAAQVMQSGRSVGALLVVDSKDPTQVIGAVHVHDLMRAGVI
jgi:arabinose-5-phosphate isomerase